MIPIALRYDQRGTIEDEVSLDFTTDFYPYIEGADFEVGPRPEVTFSAAPTDADYVSFNANWDDGGSYTFWDLLLPPSVEGTVRFPELPEGIVPGASPYYLTLGFFDASYLEGYDAIRTGDDVPPEGDYDVRAAYVQR